MRLQARLYVKNGEGNERNNKYSETVNKQMSLIRTTVQVKLQMV